MIPTITMAAGATTYTVSTDLDAYLQETIPVTTDLDAILYETLTKLPDLDALLTAIGVDETTALDALLNLIDNDESLDLSETVGDGPLV